VDQKDEAFFDIFLIFVFVQWMQKKNGLPQNFNCPLLFSLQMQPI